MEKPGNHQNSRLTTLEMELVGIMCNEMHGEEQHYSCDTPARNAHSELTHGETTNPI